MSLEGDRPKPWRLALLLLVGAYVGVVGYLVLRNESADEPQANARRVATAPPVRSMPIAAAVGAAGPTFKSNVAVQKPGPPDPASERRATESAENAADAAAALAATVGVGTN